MNGVILANSGRALSLLDGNSDYHAKLTSTLNTLRRSEEDPLLAPSPSINTIQEPGIDFREHAKP